MEAPGYVLAVAEDASLFRELASVLNNFVALLISGVPSREQQLGTLVMLLFTVCVLGIHGGWCRGLIKEVLLPMLTFGSSACATRHIQ